MPADSPSPEDYSLRDYQESAQNFERAWRAIKKMGTPGVDEVMELRIYNTPEMRTELETLEVTMVEYGVDASILFNLPESMGLYTINKDGDKRFLLQGRYIFPVRGLSGEILALIGWYPDVKKYITTPSRYFSKDILYFGLDRLDMKSEVLVVVEGIFDTLSTRSAGLNVLGTMGVNVAPYKRAFMALFKTVIAIPDNDKSGRKVVRLDAWKLPIGGKYFRWKGGFQMGEETLKVKDIDDMCRLYDLPSVKQTVLECLKGYRRKFTAEL